MPLHLPPQHKLTLSGGPFVYTVTLDGHDLSQAIRRMTIDVDPRDSLPRVEAELAIHAIEVTELGVKDAHFEVVMPDETRAALIALGWTPPVSEAACPDWSMSKEHTAHEWDGDVPVSGRFSCPGWPSPAGDR
ncbi:hypothetical protein FH608_046150 [Nonomuraea phyllanthi]|uniref:Uncharacterized protein n=1 Tax=Nonomuraea phyllanthi TaxID=2219224 RepID=A0A5C4V8R2_9ACTN|nr:hypothetical protein [Nonomuraea phyllanthi]KAB8186878.1 hypothetical protein FH608_046150 [Nonomuraea phyllanthi]